MVPEDRTVLTKSATTGSLDCQQPWLQLLQLRSGSCALQSCFAFQRRKASVREEGYLPAAHWRHPLHPRLFRPAGLTAAMFTCLLGLRKLPTLQHLNKAGGLRKDSRKDFQVRLKERCGEGAVDSRSQVLRTAGSYGRGFVLTNSEQLWFPA